MLLLCLEQNKKKHVSWKVTRGQDGVIIVFIVMFLPLLGKPG